MNSNEGIPVREYPGGRRDVAVASLVLRGVRWALSFGLLPLLLLLMLAVVGLYEPRFWRPLNLINIVRGASYLVIVSAGQMLVLIIGGFDLSVGAVVSLTSVTIALVMRDMINLLPDATALAVVAGVSAGVLAGTLIGILNGIVIAIFNVSPFMVTLATMSIAFGIGLLATDGIPIYGMPEAFTSAFGQQSWLGLPISAYLMFALLITLWWTLDWTKFGRYVYAIGSNDHAARTSGIPVLTYVVLTYGLCSLLAAIAGVLLTARFGSGEATLGESFTIQSIAAAVIGGVSLRGGVGHIGMVAVGAFFFQIVTNAMNLIRIDTKIQTIVVGIILVLAVGVDRLRMGGRSD